MNFCKLLKPLGYLSFFLMFMYLSGCNQTLRNGQQKLRIATTTSLRDSGLLDILIPEFIASYPCDISVLAVGTGAALRLGQQGEVDLLLVHAPTAEAEFMEGKHGDLHRPFMKNYFLFLGHPDKSAGLKNLSISQALKTIAQNNLVFVSRGDDSGPHKKELELWSHSTSRPEFESYTETGQGMGNTLMIASELQAFTLCDAGTYLRFQDKIDLRPVTSNQEILVNRYSVITVAADKNNQINTEAEREFYHFLNSDRSATLIQNYQLNGKTLFTPLTP